MSCKAEAVQNAGSMKREERCVFDLMLMHRAQQ